MQGLWKKVGAALGSAVMIGATLAGAALAQIKDASRAKLVLFLEPEELVDIKNKTIFIDGKESKYKVDKVWRVADEKFISSYRAEIYIPAPKNEFSKLLKIELK